MSNASGFQKATSVWRDPLAHIKGRNCPLCGRPATCAVLTTVVRLACREHAQQAERYGYDVIFGDDAAQQQRQADALSGCTCPCDGMPNAFCPIHGAQATGRSLR